jgi:2,4-dienoyl-CoA reductase-like NADH-dependent reductase (Old Yellow Enzyme family)
MSPLTRFRADESSVQMPFVKEYYAQRASVPGTLLISEGTAVSSKAAGFINVPGIWNAQQIEAWREIAEGVHSKGSFIFLQIWATGRCCQSEPLEPGSFDFATSSPSPIEHGGPSPRELTEKEINVYITQYATAAKNAIAAGMDGVEIHGANGYLIDQFTQSSCNQRTDKWGGTIENCARFALEVTKAVIAAVGPDRVGIKLTPWGKFQGMGSMHDLVPQFTYLISELRDMGIAYLHLANSRWLSDTPKEAEDIGRYVRLWGKGIPLILEGGYDTKSAREEVDVHHPEHDMAIGFGRFFISNPDLPFRVKMGISLQHYNRDSFYTPMSSQGYIDYPFSREFLETHDAPSSTGCDSLRETKIPE